jgi:hypothetical protein
MRETGKQVSEHICQRASQDCLPGRASVPASPNVFGKPGSRGRSPSRVWDAVHLLETSLK